MIRVRSHIARKYAFLYCYVIYKRAEVLPHLIIIGSLLGAIIVTNAVPEVTLILLQALNDTDRSVDVE
jgi:hypothetical protein